MNVFFMIMKDLDMRVLTLNYSIKHKIGFNYFTYIFWIWEI